MPRLAFNRARASSFISLPGCTSRGVGIGAQVMSLANPRRDGYLSSCENLGFRDNWLLSISDFACQMNICDGRDQARKQRCKVGYDKGYWSNVIGEGSSVLQIDSMWDFRKRAAGGIPR